MEEDIDEGNCGLFWFCKNVAANVWVLCCLVVDYLLLVHESRGRRIVVGILHIFI